MQCWYQNINKTQSMVNKCQKNTVVYMQKKSRIRETPTLLTDVDSRTNKILERLHDLPPPPSPPKGLLEGGGASGTHPRF